MATLEDPGLPSRATAIQTAVGLEYFTIAYNILEGVVSVVLGGLASSVALIGFGLDSFVESFSGLVVLWRFRCERAGPGSAEHIGITRSSLRGMVFFSAFDIHIRGICS